MAQSTPGPWRHDGTHVMGPDNQVVAVCRQAKPRNTLEAIANAGLIAAAPELLAACLLALEVCEREDAEFGEESIATRTVRAAVATAEGKAPCSPPSS